jgi:hypothetical protein
MKLINCRGRGVVGVGKGGRGATLRHGACSAVPTAALLVGTADLAPRINRNVGAAFVAVGTPVTIPITI